MRRIVRFLALVAAVLLTVGGFNFIAAAGEGMIRAEQTHGMEIVVHGNVAPLG